MAAVMNMDYGYRAIPGGGLYKVSGLKSDRPVISNILEKSVVEAGRLKGRKLGDKGAFNLPAVDYDGGTIAFSFVEKSVPSAVDTRWPLSFQLGFNKNTCFHLFKVNADGSKLIQLTDGRRNDYHPCFMPNRRIVFVSDRRNVMARCEGLGDPIRTG